jgi:ABC-2 type transport system permease protein
VPELRHAITGVVPALVRVSLMTAMQYRGDFLLQTLSGVVRTASRVAPLLVVYQHVDAVQGWTLPDALLVMSLFLLLAALQGGLLEPNLGEIVESVRQGTFDLVLLKPADAQLLASFRKVELAQGWDLLAALGIGGWALSQGPPPSAADAGVALLMLVCGLSAIYGVWLMAISASFYFVRVDNLRFLLMSATDAGRWPVTFFSGWVRWALTVALPVGVVTTFPATALRGTWTWQTVAVGVATGLGFVILSRVAWTRSLSRYTSASS